jgi:3-(3-hydroxy-phenyl)propionate hydroxylase
MSASLTYNSSAQEIQSFEYAYLKSPDQTAAVPVHHPIVIVGAGPVGLTLAIDLAQRGQQVLVLDNDNRLSTGSRAICFAKRTLEVWDRLGVGQAMCDKGVEWNLGKVFFKDALLYKFDLLPEPGHRRPAFINLQQYYVEAYLAVRASEFPNIEIRWKNTVKGIEQTSELARLSVNTPDGDYELTASYVAACDGSRSPLRGLLGQESKGRVFRDRFLIADVKMQAQFPTERWFWFDPPFHPNQSVLLHRQPDNVWRIDFQLGWDADPEVEKTPEKIIPRVDAMLLQALGRKVEYELQWASVYTFACQRMDAFQHGRVLFAGDAAHGVSPFGARGANSGVQDAENLAWKLDAVLRGEGAANLLASYALEREFAADENIRNSTRATDFITPKSEISLLFRNATLDLARDFPFARKLVNSGRLSSATVLPANGLNTPDEDDFAGTVAPGAVASDAPMIANGKETWLLSHLQGEFTLLWFGSAPAWVAPMVEAGEFVCVSVSEEALHDTQGLAGQRYDARPGTAYLLRPDQHIAARWRRPTNAKVHAALIRARGQSANLQ